MIAKKSQRNDKKWSRAEIIVNTHHMVITTKLIYLKLNLEPNQAAKFCILLIPWRFGLI